MNLTSITNWFGTRPRPVKRLVTLCSDGVMILLSLWLSFSLRWGELYWPTDEVTLLFVLAPLLAFPVFVRFGLYRAIIRYIGPHALWTVIKAVSLYALLLAFCVLLARVEGVPRSVHIINWGFTLLLIGGSRMTARWLFSGPHFGLNNVALGVKQKIVIYGAGTYGAQLASLLAYENDVQVVAFIDDAKALQGHQVHGYPVYSFSQIGDLLSEDVTDVLLAMPSVSRSRRNQIISSLESYPVRVKTLPSMVELAQGKIKIEDIRDVEIEDLLGRDSVSPRTDLLEANIKDKIVMVTGAGGSIGSELCRQIMQMQPRSLVLFENNEYALYAIERELLTNLPDVEIDGEVLIPVLGSVNDIDRLTKTCSGLGVHTIYHAAAYKHVPMVEKNPGAAIRNNVFGTLFVAQAAMQSSVETFVLVSTDKAVRPTNTMGATKRMAELVLQALSLEPSDTRFCMVRFGNVLGSSGSVVPLFREQIKNGGPITVTHPEITRYFMTIPEAAQLVIQAGAMGQGGDVFVLDMGEPVKINDLAKRMILLSGMEIQDGAHPDGDVSIVFTGLRPGEKLYEELLIGGNVTLTSHPKIMRAEEEVLSWVNLKVLLDELGLALELEDYAKVRLLLGKVVSGFKPICDIQDVVTQNQRNALLGITASKVH